MSKIHILKKENGSLRVIVHLPGPDGNNPEEKPWKSVFLASKQTGPNSKITAHPTLPGEVVYSSSALDVGINGWNITQEEKDSLDAGDLMEFDLTVDRLGNDFDAGVRSQIKTLTDERINELKRSHVWYGKVLEGS